MYKLLEEQMRQLEKEAKEEQKKEKNLPPFDFEKSMKDKKKFF